MTGTKDLPVIWKHRLFYSRNAETDDEEPKLEDIEGQDDIDYMSKDWLWNEWEEIGDNDDVGGPIESDHYNGSHGLKAGVANSYQTVLQYVSQATPLNRDFSNGWQYKAVNMLAIVCSLVILIGMLVTSGRI